MYMLNGWWFLSSGDSYPPVFMVDGKIPPFALTGIDMIYIKTQVFRLLRYYSPAPRNIARSDWVTQNMTHNMTSSILQPNGLHSL